MCPIIIIILFCSSDGLDEDIGRIISPKTAKDPRHHDTTIIGHGLCTVCRSRHIDARQRATSMLTVCREMMTKLVDRQQGKKCDIQSFIIIEFRISNGSVLRMYP